MAAAARCTMVRIEARQQRNRRGAARPSAAAARASASASCSQIEFTLVAGQSFTQRNGELVLSNDGVLQISSSQRFLPSASSTGLE